MQDTQLLPNQVLSEQQSSVVIKKLLAIAVSGITYLRGLFPEKAYGSKYVEDQKVMILREEDSCPGLLNYRKFASKYTTNPRYVLLVIRIITYKITESITLKRHLIDSSLNHPSSFLSLCVSNDNKMSMSCGNTKKASILLVRKLYTLMQNLGPLPDSVCLNMKLVYYDDVTPQDYQPPGFMESDSDTLVFEKEPVKLTMGEVVTPYHILKLDVATERQRLEQVNDRLHVFFCCFQVSPYNIPDSQETPLTLTWQPCSLLIFH
uniref:HORMA domain-containing protein n=1 Tax=Mola mola TaxID=94237 RepID=A0A3Q3VR98_MOLML